MLGWLIFAGVVAGAGWLLVAWLVVRLVVRLEVAEAQRDAALSQNNRLLAENDQLLARIERLVREG